MFKKIATKCRQAKFNENFAKSPEMIPYPDNKRKNIIDCSNLEKQNELLWAWVKELENKIHEMQIDQKTGAIRIDCFHNEIVKMMHFAKLLKKGVAIFLIDVDDFKKLQDERSHLWGDEVLIRLVEALQSHMRLSDLIFRFGGDEFVIIAPFKDVDDATRKRDEIESVMEKILIQKGEFNGNVSITVGVSFTDNEINEDLVHQADNDLKQRKHQKKVGR